MTAGRFTQHDTWAEVHAAMNLLGAPRNLRPRDTIAPTTQVDVGCPDADGRRELVAMRWGLIPVRWKQAAKHGPATFNARAETVVVKPMFRSAFEHRRCLVPASGFFERTDGTGERVPHLFGAAHGSPVSAFAGRWDTWRDPEGEDVSSCTVVMPGASDWMTADHDRMPVLLGPDLLARFECSQAFGTCSSRSNEVGAGGWSSRSAILIKRPAVPAR